VRIAIVPYTYDWDIRMKYPAVVTLEGFMGILRQYPAGSGKK
jgi:hypothetical protein